MLRQHSRSAGGVAGGSEVRGRLLPGRVAGCSRAGWLAAAAAGRRAEQQHYPIWCPSAPSEGGTGEAARVGQGAAAPVTAATGPASPLLEARTASSAPINLSSSFSYCSAAYSCSHSSPKAAWPCGGGRDASHALPPRSGGQRPARVSSRAAPPRPSPHQQLGDELGHSDVGLLLGGLDDLSVGHHLTPACTRESGSRGLGQKRGPGRPSKWCAWFGPAMQAAR